MKNVYLCRICLLISIFFTATTAISQTWGSPVIIDNPLGTGGTVGQFSSIVVVNGNPAISYYDATHQSLMYVRATDANGTTWGNPVAVDEIGSVGQHSTMAIVNGNPAIAYYDATNLDLKYVRASDVSGTAWGTPVTLDATGSVGEYASLKVVSGNPAVSYFDNTTDDLNYVRATDANGTTWGAPVSIDVTDAVGQYTSLCVVAGSPAISYYDQENDDLKYVRAVDLTGALWDIPQVLESANVTGLHTSMAIVNGNPAIAYYDQTTTSMRFIRASDAMGSAWNAPLDADNLASVGSFCALTIVNGNPAMSYYDASVTGLAYVRATDMNGTAWAAPVSVDGAGSGTYGQYTAIGIVNGNPAISYYDGVDANLRYVRAANVDGTSWGTPVVFDITPAVGDYTSLAKVNGHPAVAYHDDADDNLKYVRALDPAGATWGTPVVIDGAADMVGQYVSLAIVNGNPAISYYDDTNDNLKYVRAADVNGTTWGTPVNVDVPNNVGQYTSLTVISGRPAISYYDVTNTALKYVRALDNSGIAWGSPVTVDNSGIGAAGQYSCLAFVNGFPSISYYNNSTLSFIQALDAEGQSWGASVTVDATANVGQYTSMIIVNGNPAISYYNVDSTALNYIRATNPGGSAWAPGIILDGLGTPNVGQYTSLEVIAGNPAIAYFDQTNSKLKYIHANEANGATWDAPVDLANVGDQGRYASLSTLGSGITGIAFYDATKDWPMFISGSLVCSPTASTINPISCDDYVSPSGAYFWSSTNTYMDTIPNMAGCDSVITVNLTILHSTSNAYATTACDSLVGPSGTVTWYTSGFHVDVIPNAVGCDSTITVNLTINNSDGNIISPIACNSYTSPSGLYTWTTSNTYYDTLSTVTGCDSVIQVDLQVLTVDVATTTSGFDITAVDALANSYQWLDCNNGMAVIAGATSQTYGAISNGDYAVIIEALNGCVDTSACVNVNGIGIFENGTELMMAIYPNPTNGVVQISFTNEMANASLRVMDVQGNVVQPVIVLNGKTTQLDLTGLSAGVYFIEVREGEQVYRARVTKN